MSMIFTDLWTPLQISLSVACTATLLVTAIGTLCAWWLAGKRNVLATIADYLLSVPLFLPPTVLGYGLIVFLGNSGSGGSVWSTLTGTSFLFSRGAAVTAAALAGLPLYYRTAKSFFESIELHLFEAAAVDGAGRWTLLTAIILPISVPGLSAGFILAFLRAMGEFGITIMIAGNIPGKTQTVSLAIWDAVMSGRDGDATLLALLLALISLGLLSLFALFIRRTKPSQPLASIFS